MMQKADMQGWLANVLMEHDSTHQTLRCFYVLTNGDLVLEATDGRQTYVGIQMGKEGEFVMPGTRHGVEEVITPGQEEDLEGAF